jgi:copper chaperone CopZ
MDQDPEGSIMDMAVINKEAVSDLAEDNNVEVISDLTNNNQDNINETNKMINKERGIKMKKLNIEGMTCTHCSGRVDKVLNGLDGVSDVNVNLEENFATLSTSSVSDDELIKAVVDAGYEVSQVTEV